MSTDADWVAQAEEDDAALAAGFREATGGEATVSHDGAGVPVVEVARETWLAAALHARDGLGMDFLDWLSAVDQPDGDPAGVDVVLHVASTVPVTVEVEDGTPHSAVRRLLMRTRVPDASSELASLTGVWPGVAWHERETFEMFGVGFAGFADGTGGELRPLLLPEGFEGTPLRKSFVLAARASKAWPGAKEPGESGDAPAAGGRARRKVQPPGVPAAAWGPREPGSEPGSPIEEPAAKRAPRGDRPPRGERPARGERPPRREPPADDA